MSSQAASSGDLGQAVAFRDLFTALRRQLFLIVGVAVLGLTAGILAGELLPPSVEAGARVLVLPTGLDRATTVNSGDQVEPALEIELMRSTDVLFDAAKQVSPPTTAEALRDVLVVTNITDTDLLTVSVTATSQNRALELVEAVVVTYLDQRRQLAEDDVTSRRSSLQERVNSFEKQLEGVNEDLSDEQAKAIPNAGLISLFQGQRQLLQDQLIVAQTQVSAVDLLNTDPGRITERPRITDDGGLGTVLFAIGGLMLGSILGGGLALVRDRADDRLWHASDVERMLHDVPVVSVPSAELQQASFLQSAAFREIRDLVISFPVPGPTTLVFASPREDDDVAVVGSGVAHAMSRAGLTTVLADPVGAARMVDVATWLSVADGPPRFDDFLYQDVPLRDAARISQDRPGLLLLERSPNAIDRDVTVAPRLRSLLWRRDDRLPDGAATEPPSVVLVAPSINESPDGAVLAGMGDAVILVLREKSTTGADLDRTLRALRTHGGQIAAAVFLPQQKS